MARKKKDKKAPEPEEDYGTTSTPSSGTYAEDSGLQESQIVLQGGNTEGLKAIVKITELVNVEQDHDANLEVMNFDGKLTIENPSSTDRIWDVDVALKNKEFTNLASDTIQVQELGVDEEDKAYVEEFSMSGEAKNLLLVKEYINTRENADEILNISDIESDMESLKSKVAGVEAAPIEDEPADDEPTDDEPTEDDMEDDGGVDAEEVSLESFGISIGKENTVYFVIAMKSFFDGPITDLRIVKTIPSELENVQVIDSSVGLADIENNEIIWTIDELDPESTVFLKFSVTVLVESHDPVRTGPIEVTFKASTSFAGGFGVDSFEGYSRNKFHVDTVEKDEAPGVWDCQLVFENTSEFTIELFNADVYAAEAEGTKLIEIDAENPHELPAGAQWISAPWKYESDEYPSFRKKLEFRILPEFLTEVNSTIKIGDVELGLASITGEIAFVIPEMEIPGEAEEGVNYVPTYTETDIDTTLKTKNDGSAPLNDLKISHENFSDEYKPPEPEEVKVLKDGKEIAVQPEDIRVEDNALIYEVKDLKDRDEGMFDPNSEYELQYPIHASSPTEDSRFESSAVINANTFPLGPELEYRIDPEEVPKIVAIHIRRKYRMGKDIIPVGNELGKYQITIHVENVGNMTLKDMVLQDKVPDNFERSDFSMEPEVTDLEGEDILKWDIVLLEEGEKIEVSYTITGSGAYNPSGAQLAL